MADVTITKRKRAPYGKFRRETGTFTAGAGDFTVKTGLMAVITFRIYNHATGGDHDGPLYMNYSDAGTTAAPGKVFIDGSAITSDLMSYEALGSG